MEAEVKDVRGPGEDDSGQQHDGNRPPPSGREGSSQPAPLAQLQLLSNAEAIDETWRLALKCTTTQWLFDDFRQYE